MSPSSPPQQVQSWSPVHRLFRPGGSAPGWPGHHCLLPVPAAGPAGQADGHLPEPAVGEPAHEASQACVPCLCPDNTPCPSPQRTLIPAPAGPTGLALWSGIPAPHLGLGSRPPGLSTLFPGHWGRTHAVPSTPTAAKPLSQMRMATPMLMRALPMAGPEVRPTPGQ